MLTRPCRSEPFLYSAVRPCLFNNHFRWIPWRRFPQPKNKINKPVSNNRGILIAAVFHFVVAVEKHE